MLTGTFEENKEKYIIIGGLLFNIEDEKDLEKALRPIHSDICNVFGVEELYGNRNKKHYKYLCVSIGAEKRFTIVVFVIDKDKSYILKNMIKKSFKYNKAIEYLVYKLKYDKYIKDDDQLYIKIDKFDLSEKERKNISEYLPKTIKNIEKVEPVDSKESICMQLADVIVNRFSKKRSISTKDKEIMLLHPWIATFLDETLEEYVDDLI